MSTIPKPKLKAAWIRMNQPHSFDRIGIQGGQGSFNEEAVQAFVKQHGMHSPDVQYLYTSEAVLAAVVRGDIARGQCAIYNSTGGFVQETTEALARYRVRIVSDFALLIAHALMIRPDQDWAAIDTVMCHPQVLAQCRMTLAHHYPHLKQISGTGEMIDNARTAQALARRELPNHVAVMGSRGLADLYGLRVVADNLQDVSGNATHFIHVVKL